MKTIYKYTFIASLAVFLGIQLIPVPRDNPPVISEIEAPIEVKNILQRSCYDCHSNQTSWPWYGYVAPVSWLVAYDVGEGREELNFSEWTRYAADTEMKEEIIEEILEGEMPLPIYRITHPEASVSEKELATMKQWAGVPLDSSFDDHDDD